MKRGISDLVDQNGQGNSFISVSSFSIVEISPTKNSPLTIASGSVSGTYADYCILENDVDYGHCPWTAGTIPTSFTTSTTEGNVNLYLWVRTSDHSISNRSDSNMVYVDRVAPVMTSATVTNASPTNTRNYALTYGTITGSYTQYCILPNSTTVASCSWVGGTLPSLYQVPNVDGAYVLSVWTADAAGNVSNLVQTNSVTLDTSAPSLASLTITNSAYTTTTTLGLTAGAVTGTYTQYCINENNTNVSSCSWQTGTLPSTFTATATENAKTLYAWLKDAAGNVSAMVTSNTVTLDTTNPSLTLNSLTGGQTVGGGVPVAVQWTASDTGFGATPITLEYSSNSGSSWSALAGPLSNSGTYSWTTPAVTSSTYRVRVTAVDQAGHSVTASSTSDFTINSTNPVVTVTAPNGGETLQAGSAQNVDWTVSGLPVGSYTASVDYSTNGGTSWTNLASGLSNAVTYGWSTSSCTAGNDQNSVKVRVTVTDSLSAQTADVSDSVFALDCTAPTVSLTNLTGGQAITGNQNTTITWTASDAHLGTTPIKLEYSSDSGSTWTTIAAATANSSPYTWAVPNVTSQTYRVRVTATDLAGRTTSSASTADFSVNSTHPVVAVTSPNGGEIWKGGSSKNITWTATDLPAGSSTAKLEYSLNSGSTWTTIIASTANSSGANTYAWTLPAATDIATAKVRVTVTDSFSIATADDSDAVFTIDSTAPTLALTQPNGGEYLSGASTYSITWTSSDTNLGSNPITIEKSADSGSTWSSVAASVAHPSNPATYSWTVPSVDVSTYRIRLTSTDAAGNATVVSSASDFSIISTAPSLASATITNASYTNDTTLHLTYGAVTGTYSKYCILLNDTNLSNCTFTAGTLPSSIAGGSDGTKTAYIWLKGPSNLVSSMVTSNTVTLDTTPPTLAGLTILNATPTPSRGYLLSYTSLSETISAYCILENNTSVSGCAGNWVTASAPPDSYTVTATQNAKALTIWVKDLAGNQQATGRTSNSVTYTNVLAISPTSSTLSSTVSLDLTEGLRFAPALTVMSGGKILVAGGCNQYGAYYSIAKVYDPATDKWAYAGHMSRKRCYATSTLLADGRVLVAGGLVADNTSTNTAEIYDPTANTWTMTYPMATSRAKAAAVKLASGKILVSGGYTDTNSSTNSLSSTEIYDPTTQVWIAGPAMNSKRYAHQSILRGNGTVLIIGGLTGATTATNTSDLFTAAGHTGTIAAGPTMTNSRGSFGAVLLTAAESPAAVESIIVMGGTDGNGTYRTGVELYNGSTFAAKTAVTGSRANPGLVKLADGTIMVMGGYNGSYLSTTGRYNPLGSSGSGTWTAKAAMTQARSLLTPILLSTGAQSGKVVTLFGEGTGNSYLNNAILLYDPTGDTWNTATLHAAAPAIGQVTGAHYQLSSGKILVCSWRSHLVAEKNACFMIDPKRLSYDQIADMAGTSYVRQAAAYAELADGRVMVMGGINSGWSNLLNTAEIYNPTTNAWTTVANMPRYGSSMRATALPGNRIMWVGGNMCTGNNCGAPSSITAIYDVAGNSWTMPGSAALPDPVAYHRMVVTPTGRIFIHGGQTASAVLNTLYEWNNATTSWTAKATSTVARRNHGMVYIPGGTDGRILVAGGYTDTSTTATGSVEIYDIGTNTWSTAASFPSSNTGAEVCITSSSSLGGDVLIMGNWTGTQGMHDAIYRYSLSGNSWSNTGLSGLSAGQDSLMGGYTCGTFADGRPWFASSGEQILFQVMNVATPVPYTASYGDGAFTYSVTSGTGALDDRNYFIPTTPLVSSTSSTVRVDDGSGQNASATASVP